MKSRLAKFAALTVAALSLAAWAEDAPSIVKGKPVKLFICSGQSNMGGGGYAKDHGMDAPRNDIWYRVATPPDNDNGGWVPLGERIYLGERKVVPGLGPEAGFAVKMAEAYPDHTIAILKSSQGATGIGYWTPGEDGKMNKREGYKQLDTLIPAAIADLEAKKQAGVIPGYEVAGFVWMQGEGDANGVNRKDKEYLGHLHTLLKFINEKAGTKDIPVVLGRISIQLSPECVRETGALRESKGNKNDQRDFLDDGKKRGPIWHVAQLERVRADQEQFCQEYPKAAWVDIDDLEMKDGWHFHPQGYVEMGHRFADAMLKLLEIK